MDAVSLRQHKFRAFEFHPRNIFTIDFLSHNSSPLLEQLFFSFALIILSLLVIKFLIRRKGLRHFKLGEDHFGVTSSRMLMFSVGSSKRNQGWAMRFCSQRLSPEWFLQNQKSQFLQHPFLTFSSVWTACLTILFCLGYC